MSSGTDISKGLTELWLCKEIPRSTFVVVGMEDKGASCLQPNPEGFYTLRGKMGQERDKAGERGKARARQRKLE